MKLLGLAEIAEIFGVTKQVVTNWKARKSDFPKPIAELKSGPVWSRDDITNWAVDQRIEIKAPIADEESTESTSAAADSNRAAQVVAFMNMKGGVGKSTLAFNLGWYAAYKRNLRVLFVDIDPQFNLSQYVLGSSKYEELHKNGEPMIDSALSPIDGNGKYASLGDVIYEVHNFSDGSCVHLAPARLELAWAMKYAIDKPHLLRDNISEVRSDYDLIVIDCSPTESILTTATYLASDFFIVPVRPEFLSTIGLPLLLKSLKGFKATYKKNESPPEMLGIVFNGVGDKVEHKRARRDVSRTSKANNWHVFKQSISHSDSYPAGARAGQPIFRTSYAHWNKISELDKLGDEFLERLGI